MPPAAHNVGMPKRSSNTRRQKDTQQLARMTLDAVVPDAEPTRAQRRFKIAASASDSGDIHEAEMNKSANAKNPAAVALGRLGGLRGGKARASKLSAAKRSEIASKAARTRWKKKQ